MVDIKSRSSYQFMYSTNLVFATEPQFLVMIVHIDPTMGPTHSTFSSVASHPVFPTVFKPRLYPLRSFKSIRPSIIQGPTKRTSVP